MTIQLPFQIYRQPDELTCGPTSLLSVYQYFGQTCTLESVIQGVEMLEEGGTLAANLGCHALELGYSATIHSFNINLFDPSWFSLSSEAIGEKLAQQMQAKEHDSKLVRSSRAYMSYLEKGGRLSFEDLTPALIESYLVRNIPIICGLSATYLWKCSREIPDTMQSDDVRGLPSGHFVVLTGLDHSHHLVTVNDPYLPNPVYESQVYQVDMNHLIAAILLGVVTYDANLLILEPSTMK